jgi:Flp pilus assembly protein TadG
MRMTLRHAPSRIRRDGERGSLAVEIVLVAPAFVLLLLLISAGGQWVSATGQVGGAARDAARAASVARSPDEAPLLAQQAADQDLAGLCAGDPSVTVTPMVAGQPAPLAGGQDVQVLVRCDVGLAAFRLVGFPASQTFSAVAVAPLDSFVCRSGTC